jgi:N-acetyl-gamma-glutamyl-phosphate reductase common form
VISIVVVGARGHTGGELLPLLWAHPEFDLVAVGSSSVAGQPVNEYVDGMEGCDLHFSDIRPVTLKDFPADAYVLALPNGFAAGYVDILDKRSPDTVVVDLSADHRFDSEWAYGQPERFSDQIHGATRIANPGCYATGAQLALAPVLDDILGVPVIFGVSGYSGAGTTPSRKNDQDVLHDNLLPYQLTGHVHEREVTHHLGRDVRFLPHVASFFRGISLTVSLELDRAVSEDELLKRYRAYYSGSHLVDVRREIPEVAQVRGTHKLILGGFSVSDDEPHRVALVSVLDNLLKGAASQAVQNLNLAFGLDALMGLSRDKGRDQ